jgi:hypothetical protein
MESIQQAFDAYHKWLGIPPESQPPHHYRLLGLQPFESDPEVIQAAADQRMLHLRAYQTGKHSDWSQRLLNEVAAARVCLLNAAKKEAYDRELRKTIADRVSETPPAAAEPPNPAISLVSDVLATPPRIEVSPHVRRKKRLAPGPVIAALVAMTTLLIAAVAYNVLQRSGSSASRSRQTAGSSSEPAKLGTAAGKLPNGGKAADPSPKIVKTPHSERHSATDVTAAKRPPLKTGSHPGLLDSPDLATGSNGSGSGHSTDEAVAPIEFSPVAPSQDLELAPPAKRRAGEPSGQAQAEAMRLARNRYKDELVKARTTAEKRVLAKKMLDAAEAAANADAATFALFRLAQDTAVEAVDAQTAVAAVDGTAERYEVDAMKAKADLLAAVAREAKTPVQHLSLAAQAARLMIEAQEKGDRDRASNLAGLATAEGRRDKEFVALVKAYSKECQKSKDGAAGGPGKVKLDKRIEEIAESGGGTAAVVRPSVRFRKWFSLLASPSELASWETGNCHCGYLDGMFELRQGEMLCPVVVKDAAIRAMVKRQADGEVHLLIRKSDQGCYVARVSGGTLTIVKRKGSNRPADEDVLKKASLPPRVRVIGFRLGFSAIGDVLTVFAGDQPVLQAQDSAFSEGTVGVGTDRTDTIYIGSVEMLISNKMSLVEDRRSSAAGKSLPSKRP